MPYTTYGGDDHILKAGDNHIFNCAVTDPSAQPDESGTKWIKAGTLLAGDSDFINQPDPSQSVLLKPTTDASQAQAVLLHDVDITADGVGNGAGIVAGEITTKFMDDKVKAVYTADVIKGLKAVLPNVIVTGK